VPLFAQGELLGCLSLGTAAGQLPDRKQQWAKTVADAVGLSLANLRLRESLRQQSIIDVLTGLFNRRYMEETLEREVRRCARAKTPLGIMMMDIDHFKSFNDTHGHAAGDVLLAELGSLLRSRIRADDIACRYGGEEFTLILPDSSLDVTARRAEDLLAGVRSLRVEYSGHVIGPVTMSLGVAAFPGHGGGGAEVLRAADKALYAAKGQGRDRVVVAPP
jgi:diguanylate cyclase (GGDEF)-like protein